MGTWDDANDAPIFWLRVHHDRIKPQSDAAQEAFTHLQELLEELEDNSVHLCSGELLLVNNMRALHRRTEFKADFNGDDRLLVRSYLKDVDRWQRNEHGLDLGSLPDGTNNDYMVS